LKKKNVEVIRTSFEKVSWKPNEEPKMASKAELLVTLLYKGKRYAWKNLWLSNLGYWWGNSNIVSCGESEGYRLAKEHAENLKKVLSQ
jgi:hypothetical protein